jgi:predicted HTH transcriptional regulator
VIVIDSISSAFYNFIVTMTTEDIQKLRDLGEVSKVQFKERILDKYDIGCELVAMSNARGGQLVIGINDKTGAFNPLSYAEVQETTNLLSNMASENVVPNILLEIDTISVEGGSVVIATIKEGINKPYHDNKGIVWMKNGADKRKVFDNAELAEMMTECGSFTPDGGKVFRDKVNDAVMEGNLLHQFETIMSFFTRNLKNVQVEKEFNSLGELEIPYVSLMEFVVNALVHRSLNWKAPIRIFIFDNRVEIHSPGTLPNGLQVEDITNGTSMPRNNFLFSNAIYLLPYTGAGSGIQRALEEGVQVEFTNDERIHEFLTTIKRNKDLDSNLADSDTTPNTFSEQSDTTPNTSDECPDTFSEHSDTTPNTSDECPNTRQMKLTNKQKDIVNFCSVPRSSREILERVGVKYHNSNIKRYVTELVEAGYLERTIPDNPFDMNQKYKKKQSL